MKKNNKKGLFLTFEGIEGSGKTTQIQALGQWLREKGYGVLMTREPGGTPVADEIRSYLLSSETQGLSPSRELFLYEVARRDHVMRVIQPALQKGVLVLCDRFTDATLAYQGYGRGLPLQNIKMMNEIATGGLKPDGTFLFDLPVQVGLQRALSRIDQKQAKGEAGEDRFEKEALVFHEKVRQGYLTLARKEKRFHLIHADRKQPEIFDELCREVEKIL